MAFTTTYTDTPTRFGAPLLAPVVLGAPPDEFMFHRVLALHAHICLFILRRARAPAADAADATASATSGAAAPRNALGDGAGSLALLWGTINLSAAQRYERRLRLLPFVAWAKLNLKSGMAARRVPYPASLILPPPRAVGVVVATRGALSARERAARARRSGRARGRGDGQGQGDS